MEDLTVNNIDKLWGYMIKCSKDSDNNSVELLSDFSSYTKMFFREINKLPDCYFGDDSCLLDLDEIIGLSNNSSYRLATAIISHSKKTHEIIVSYINVFEDIVKNIHYIYNERTCNA